ncbi:MAG: hypothetical protein RMJ04_01515 [Geminicoccaceae bacterium]|nr:hypothetical protein [Geminicoccaceae bacterium]MDW8123433.1 hypothetical protein [Geminicoccaceae bacterium]
MFDSDESLDADGAVVFRDLITLALAGFLVCIVLVLPHINPAKAKPRPEGLEPPGNVVVEIRWPDPLDADVDLWVQGPDDVPVGYSNKGGRLFNLLRDDLGHRADASGLNYEVAYSRGIEAGEYVVNLHLYRDQSGASPIPVTVVASVKPSAKESTRQLLATTVELVREGEERTVFRFRLDAAGNLVPGSVHDLPLPLRARRPS